MKESLLSMLISEDSVHQIPLNELGNYMIKDDTLNLTALVANDLNSSTKAGAKVGDISNFVKVKFGLERIFKKLLFRH